LLIDFFKFCFGLSGVRLLMRELDKTSMSEWTSVKLTTIGESCRVVLRELIRTMIDWVLDRIETYGGSRRDCAHVYARLRLI
jgi:hypothetical protein